MIQMSPISSKIEKSTSVKVLGTIRLLHDSLNKSKTHAP